MPIDPMSKPDPVSVSEPGAMERRRAAEKIADALALMFQWQDPLGHNPHRKPDFAAAVEMLADGIEQALKVSK